MSGVAIGIDLGGTNLRLARVASDGHIEGRTAEAVSRDPAVVIRRIEALCRDFGVGDVGSIGIGIPGRVDAVRRQVLSGGYLDLSGVDVAPRLEDATGKPVVVDNDCNMALVAEMRQGAARGRADLVMFTIGTGIGGAIALGGRIVRATGTAGQLGHLQVAEGGALCNCGRRGCVETTSSGSALVRLVDEAGLPAGTRVQALLRAADAGDAGAGRVLDRWIGPLRAAIDSMVAAVAPELVLLGGGLGVVAHRALARAPALAPWYQCPVSAASLGDDAGVIGAGLSALDSHQDQARRSGPGGSAEARVPP